MQPTNHHPRPVTQYGVELLNGWPTKVYGLAVQGEPGQELVDAARRVATTMLPARQPRAAQLGAQPDSATPDGARSDHATPDSAGPDGLAAAFVIAHRARPACFVLVYWWSSAVDLSLAYFRSPLDEPADLTPMPAYATGCVWELALAEHERAAWVRHLLSGEPDLDAYLSEVPPTEVS